MRYLLFCFMIQVPDLPPSKIRAIAQSGSSISLTWDDVNEKGRNGVILGYKVHLRIIKRIFHIVLFLCKYFLLWFSCRYFTV